MTATEFTLRTIPLTKAQRAALEYADPLGWQGFWLQFENATDADMEAACHEQDCEPGYLREQAAAAKVSAITDQSMTLVIGSELERDIYEKLESVVSGFQVNCLNRGEAAAIKAVLRKMIANNPDLE